MRIYRIYNSINGKSYIGISKTVNQDNWYTRVKNKPLKSDVKKFGKINFIFSVMFNDQPYELIRDYRYWDSLMIHCAIQPHGYVPASELPIIYEYILIDTVSSEIFHVTDVENFCINKKLCYGDFHSFLKSKIKHYKNFELIEKKEINEGSIYVHKCLSGINV